MGSNLLGRRDHIHLVLKTNEKPMPVEDADGNYQIAGNAIGAHIFRHYGVQHIHAVRRTPRSVQRAASTPVTMREIQTYAPPLRLVLDLTEA